MSRATTTRTRLDRAELLSSGVAAVVSGGLYLTLGEPYLARGVVGDSLGFAVLVAPLALRSRRARYEALVCLAGIGAVLVMRPTWPLTLPSAAWWAIFCVDLAFYLVVRRIALTPVGPPTGRSRPV
jgi:hypothetical protein